MSQSVISPKSKASLSDDTRFGSSHPINQSINQSIAYTTKHSSNNNKILSISSYYSLSLGIARAIDIMSEGSNKKQKTGPTVYVPTKQETVLFDPTSIGLPQGWSLTDWSTLKG